MWWDEPKKGIPLLILLGVLLGIGFNVVQEEPLPWIAEAKKGVSLDELDNPGEANPSGDVTEASESETAQDVDWLGIPESEYPINITLEQAKTLYDSGKVLFLDSREESDYMDGHIEGALFAPYDDVGADPDWLDSMATHEKVLIAYCDGGECELSINLGFAIAQAGHRHVCVFEEGYPAWKEAGFPTRMGKKP